MLELVDMSNQNKTPISYNYSKVSVTSSKEVENQFYLNYHFLCNKCKHVPIMDFSKKGKISYSSCLCQNSYYNLSIEQIFDYLYKIKKDEESEEEESGTESLKCLVHNEKFSFYCKELKTNFCLQCDKCSEQHNSHIEFGKDDRHIKEKLDYIKNKINNADEIKINKIKLIEGNQNDIFGLNIDNNIDNNEQENENNIYDDILNIKNESNFHIYESERNFINLFKIIINDYENYPNYNLLKTIKNLERFASIYFVDINIINLKYKIYEKNIINNSRIQLFGREFVDNNKENCFLIIHKNIIKLSNNIKLEDIFNEVPKFYPIHLKVQLIERKRKKMTNFSFMFNDISSISSSNIGKYDTRNIKEMNYMFYNCKFTHLPDISNWNTENVIDMSYLFSNCSSLEELPDISRWDTTKVINMCYMFNNCTSLKEFPDISNWNTENVKDFNNMFENCSLISSLPDLSKWKVEQAKHMKCMFKNCSSLTNIFDLSKWSISQETEIDDILEGNILLKYPDTLKYKDNKIFKYFISFYNFCENLYKNLSRILESLILLFSFVFIPYLLYLLIYHFFTGFYLSYSFNNTKNFINNPFEYFELRKKSQEIFRKKFSNITNETKIKEMMNNVIKRELNFTLINKNTEFEHSINLFKIYAIILKILSFGKIGLIFTFLNIYLNFRLLDILKSLNISIVSFLSNIASLIFEILDNNNIENLSISIRVYYGFAKELFTQKLPINFKNELDLLESSSTPIIYSIANFILFTVCNIILWKIILYRILI